MIWDEGLRTALHSVQRYIVSSSFPAKRPLRPLVLFSALHPTEGGITSADAFRRITSPDVSPGITSCEAASLPDSVGLASRHVLRRHCDLGLSCPALRLMFYFSITSCEADWLLKSRFTLKNEGSLPVIGPIWSFTTNK